jgi:preprotein translocase subunit SecG
MYILFTFVHVVVCIFLIIVVLLQSGKAADLAGAFGGAGSQTAFGPRGATNFLSRATTWCAIMFMATSMTLVKRQASTPGSMGSVFERMGSKPAPADKKPAAPSTPGVPVQVPVPVPQTQQPGQPLSQTPFSPSPQQQAPAQTAPAPQTPPPPPAKKP